MLRMVNSNRSNKCSIISIPSKDTCPRDSFLRRRRQARRRWDRSRRFITGIKTTTSQWVAIHKAGSLDRVGRSSQATLGPG